MQYIGNMMNSHSECPEVSVVIVNLNLKTIKNSFKSLLIVVKLKKYINIRILKI